MSDEFEKIRRIANHIRHVQDNCLLLAENLAEQGELKLARHLVAQSMEHDQTKFYGQEYEILGMAGVDKSPQAELVWAITQHNEANEHHPEHWDGGIHAMPRCYLAEMIADWKSRSAEKGTSLMNWIHGEAMKRYSFNKRDKVYRTIIEFANILCEPAFQPVKKK